LAVDRIGGPGGLLPTVRVVACLHPLRSEPRIDRYIPSGGTVSDCLRAVDAPPRIWGYAAQIDDQPIPENQQGSVRPPAGSTVILRARVAGSDSGKDFARTALMLAAVAGASAIGGPGMGWAMARAGALVATQLVVNAVIPLPKQRWADTDFDPTTNLTNGLMPYGVVPRVYGKHRIFPPMAAQPYYHDKKLWLLFAVGYGRLEITDVRVGDDLIGDYLTLRYAGAPEGDYEIRQGYVGDATRTITPPVVTVTIYGGPEDEIPESSGYTANETYTVGVTEPCDEIRLAFDMPEGIGTYWKGTSGDGTSSIFTWGQRTATLTIRARTAGTPPGSWVTTVTTMPKASHGDYKRTTAWINLRSRLSTTIPQDYNIQIMRGADISTAPSGEEWEAWTFTAERVCNTIVVQEITEIAWSDPVELDNVATIGIVVPMDDEHAGNRELQWDRINCVAESYLPIYSGGNWTTIDKTSNPASIVRDILTGSANAHPVATTRLDNTSLVAWYTFCGTTYQWNGVVDRQMTVYQMLEAVCAIGRASPEIVDSLFGVVLDTTRATIVQEFTPRNSWGFHATRTLPEPLHAIKAQFMDAAKGWQQAERWVFLDGYNAGSATNLQTVEYWGCTSAVQIDKLACYHINCNRLRLERVSLEVDMEHLVCTRGDRVLLSHDAPLHGKGWGRIKSVAEVAGNTISVTLDESVYLDVLNCRLYTRTLQAGTPYYNCFESNEITYSGTPAWVTTLTFNPAMTGTSLFDVGDLVQFGRKATGTEIAHDYIVAGIKPHEDLSATLDLVEYQPGVFTAGTAEPYEPNVESIPPGVEWRDPPAPTVLAVQTDEWVLWRAGDGTLRPQILVTIGYESGLYAPVESVEVQAAPYTTGTITDWHGAGTFTGPPSALSIKDVDQSSTYAVRMRSRGAHNRVSDWVRAETTGILVVGKATPPPDPSNLFLSPTGLRWSYPDAPPDLLGFEVRAHTGDTAGWDNARPLTTHPSRPLVWPIDESINGTVTFYVKAVDTSGNYSTNSASCVSEFPDPVLPHTLIDDDYFATSWPGQKTHCTRNPVSGYLEANSGGPDGYWEMWYAPPSYIILPSEVPAGYESAETLIVYSVEAEGASWWVECQTAAGAAWVPWPGVFRARGAFYLQMRIKIAGGPNRGVLKACSFLAGTPDTVARYTPTSYVAGHYIFSVADAGYTDVTGMDITITDTSSGAAYATPMTMTTTTCSYGLRNAAGTYVPGGANVLMHGIRWVGGP
jgi:hypothetical protein